MVSRGFGEINDTGSLLVRITRVPETPHTALSVEGEEDFWRHGCKGQLSIHITGNTEKRATNIVLVNGMRVPIGDVPFSLFLRLVVESFRNRKATVSKGRLRNAGYISADGEYQSIHRLREAFAVALDGLDPRNFIESCEHRSLRLSTHPLITYDKKKLLQHRNGRVRRLAGRLP